jgi:hypothetical protein
VNEEEEREYVHWIGDSLFKGACVEVGVVYIWKAQMLGDVRTGESVQYILVLRHGERYLGRRGAGGHLLLSFSSMRLPVYILGPFWGCVWCDHDRDDLISRISSLTMVKCRGR